MRPTHEKMALSANCGRVIPGSLNAAERISERRVYDWVRAVLAEGSADAIEFDRLLRERVRAGEELYGDDWRERDNVAEAIEELVDFVAYLLFEAVRRDIGRLGDSLIGDELGKIAQEAIALSMRLRRYERLMDLIGPGDVKVVMAR